MYLLTHGNAQYIRRDTNGPKADDTSSSPVRQQLQHASDPLRLALLPPGDLPRRCHRDRLHHLRRRDRCCCDLRGHPQQWNPQEVKFFSHCLVQMVLRFQGIPFAQPPIAELRFQDPEPVHPWEGVKDCSGGPPSMCPQVANVNDPPLYSWTIDKQPI